MTTKIKSSTWSDFSRRFVRFHDLPKGSEVRLYYKHTGRRKRSDFQVERMPINKANIARLNGTDHVSELLANARTILSTDIDACGLEMRLYGPDGDRIYGNTHLQTVRSMAPALQD